MGDQLGVRPVIVPVGARSFCVALLAMALVAPQAVPAAEPIASLSSGMSARGTWESNDHQSYRYTLHRECYCASPNDVQVEVRDGQVVGVIGLNDRRPVDPRFLNDYRTISQLFAQVDEAVARHPDSLLIEYDRHLGYPKRVRIDFSYRMADEELAYSIEDVIVR